jgi:hypothetical protein
MIAGHGKKNTIIVGILAAPMFLLAACQATSPANKHAFAGYSPHPTFSVEGASVQFADDVKFERLENNQRVWYRLLESTIGDVNLDGELDQAALIEMQTAGTGVFHYLAVSLGDPCGYKPLASVFLGDRVEASAMVIYPQGDVDQGMITVMVGLRGLGVPMAERPSVRVSRMYRAQDGKLVQLEQY